MTSAYHHVGVRVSDIDDAIVFYRDALGGQVLVEPYVVTGDVANAIAGAEGTRMHMCQIGFDDGFVELFQFEPAELNPTEPIPYTHQRVLHFGMQVDDVPRTLEQVEAHGGSRVFDPRPLGKSNITFCYCRDPDGNVIEIADAGMGPIVSLVGAREKR